jgi:hypothetical protein
MTSFEAYRAHLSPKCSCLEKRGPGLVTATMKRREDDESIWYEGESCSEGKRLWNEVLAETSLVLNAYGESLTMYPGMSPVEWEESELSTCIAVHEICGCFVEVHRVSGGFSVAVCRGCCLRYYFPNSLNKISDLRQYARIGRSREEKTP